MALASSFFGAPLLARAAPAGRVLRVGVLSWFHKDGTWEPSVRRAFMELMAARGYAEGKEAAYEWRYAERDVSRLATLAAELVRLRPDALLSFGSLATRAVAKATSMIPIVRAVADALKEGYAGSLGRPTGNVTDLSTQDSELLGKFMELLKAIVPGMTRFAILQPGGNPTTADVSGWLEEAARSVGVEPLTSIVRNRDEIVS